MLKTLDRYLLTYFFQSLFVVSLAAGLMIIVINMVDMLRYFVDKNTSILIVLEYYLYFAGWVIKSFLPMFVMLASLFSVSILARRQEILAMKASGISLYRIALPFLVVGALLSVGHFYYNEYIFPAANKKRIEMREFVIENKSRSSQASVRNLYRQISPGHFYTISNYNSDRNEGTDFKLYKTENNTLSRLMTAEKIVFIDLRWQAIAGFVRTFDKSKQETFDTFDTLALTEIRDSPSELAKRLGKPEDMSLDELKHYIEVMKRTGGQYTHESLDLKIKYAFPVTSFVVVLICVPFAANPRRGGIAASFAAGALIALSYFVLFRISQSSGYNQKISEDVAAWGINGLFFLVGLFLMIRARK
ncbi:MAG: LptF/LptG family permease [candidate division Zixibacteria bacterium]|nr:LptF/LptG family permease [candidate division Zixibacteria bacterium]